ncbi:S41 family peptidase [Streptomyces sp. NBC_01387]|uniref:S41 family peptidase n=1 Tax=unclassified Streptomyces TaxID=2593676 RepID=UPI00225AA784|nr:MULTISPECIES: S41 family peptidase [unclassified Streptomyces]MCX4550762.1 S41 family peptidase [Streptomyces sp. NBC_01500]WSC22197.1 S41 family peptidase [Streptomyces sp. NBC_01766]WSV56044.1 S41 family peptidase [Streptomyces sp. NBC_01014]
MSGPDYCSSPRSVRRGAVLTLVFVSVLATASATNSLPGEARTPRPTRTRDAADTVDRGELVRAASEAEAAGESGTKAAEEVVSHSGDRWGAVYDRSEYQEFEDSLDGEYTGVGLWARRSRDGHIEIERVRPGGPAARAGLRAGDVFRTIDGRQVGTNPVTDVVTRLRGGDGASTPGTPVVVGVRRGPTTVTRTLRRARLTTEAVTVGQLADRATMIKVTAFTRGSGERVQKAVSAAPAHGGILLDLRGNSGGLVTEATAAASALLDGGLVATYDVHGAQRAVYAHRGGDTDRPLVVLIDGGTMSAAELLTGALQDRGRAVTVGSRTFGKGSVQMPSALPGGAVAELTVGHYRTPAGRSVDGRGITPDVTAGKRAEATAETVLSGLGGGA